MRPPDSRSAEAAPAVMPRIYRLTRFARFGGHIMYAAMIAMMIAHLVLVDARARRIPASTLAVLGLVVVAWVRHTRIRFVLREREIEIFSFFGGGTFARTDIEGRRGGFDGRPGFLSIRGGRADRSKLVAIERYLQRDADFDAWLASLPDLDARDAARFEEEIAADSSLGPSRDERVARANRAHGLTQWLEMLATALVVWSLFSRSLLPVALLASLPWLAFALAASSPRIFTLTERVGELRASLFRFPLLASAGSLLMFIRRDFNSSSTRPLLVMGVFVAVVFVLAAVLADHRVRKGSWLAQFAVLALLYGVCTVDTANTVFDRSPPYLREASVLARSNVRAPTLRLAAWGNEGPMSVDVSLAVYESTRVGGVACIETRPGFFDVPWWRVVRCRGGAR